MHFTFRKERLERTYMAPYGLLGSCWMYTIMNGDKKIGRFFQSEEVSFLAFEENDIRIDYIRKFFRQTQYPIIDQKTNAVVGGYNRLRYLSGWAPYGKLSLNGVTYKCEKLKPDVKRKFFKKETWNHFKIRVSNASEAVTYSFKFEYKHFHTIIENAVPFQGEITLVGNNLMLLFTGIFLVDQVLEFEAARSA